MGENKTVPVCSGPPALVELALKVLGNIYDPDLQFSIVELGFIYNLDVSADGLVKIRMTLTSPACPYGPALIFQVKQALKELKEVREVEVELVWDPPWGPERMSEAIRLELGFDV